MNSHSEDYELLDRCNESELYQNCRRRGFVLLPNTPKDQLISYLLAEEEPPVDDHTIDTWRHKIMSFLIEHWAVVFSQLICPAKTKDPLACFQCVDPQVIFCVVDNKTNEPLIAAQRLVRRPVPQ